MRYRIADIDIPRSLYASTDKEWRELPDGERIVHVFGTASPSAYAGTQGGTVIQVLIEKDEPGQ